MYKSLMMSDPKEEYYFTVVPRLEADSPHIDWDVYNTLLNVVLTYSCLETRLSKFLSEWDLFPSAFNLLAILAREDGKGVHLSRISELLAVSRANVTGLVDVLARKGLVNRVASSSDRRVRLAKLTDKGGELIQEILPRYYKFNAGICESMAQDDIRVLTSTLTRLREQIYRESECVAETSASAK